MKICSLLTEILKFLFSFEDSIVLIVHHPTPRVGQCCFDPKMYKNYFAPLLGGGVTSPKGPIAQYSFNLKSNQMFFPLWGYLAQRSNVAQCSFNLKTNKNNFSTGKGTSSTCPLNFQISTCKCNCNL